MCFHAGIYFYVFFQQGNGNGFENIFQYCYTYFSKGKVIFIIKQDIHFSEVITTNEDFVLENGIICERSFQISF